MFKHEQDQVRTVGGWVWEVAHESMTTVQHKKVCDDVFGH
jgi:hypothetical protein